MGIQSTLKNLGTLGERLKAERDRLGWSRDEMANYGEISRASQRLYDANDRIPSLTYLLLLANAGADFNYLLHGERSSTNYPEDFLHLSQYAVKKAYDLSFDMWKKEPGRVSTKDDARELFIKIAEQLSEAESLNIDTETLVRATTREPKKA